MAVDLETIVFKSDTTQLREAADRIAALTAAIAALSASEKSAADVAKDTAKATKAKLKLESELVILKAKLLAAEQAAANASNGTTQANDKAAKKAQSLADLMARLNNTFIDLANGQTRAESSTLQLARTLGASAAQMDQVRASLQQIAGLRTNPFDATLGSLRSIQGELDTLNDRSRLAAQGIALSTNQLKEYSRLGNEIRGQMQGQNLDPTQGSGLVEFNRRLAESQNKYLAIANTVNTLTAEEKKRNDVLTAQRNIMAELEQKNRSIQDSINRNSAITTAMQGGASQSRAGTEYDNAKSMQGATPEQLARIQERITLTQKLTESERLLNVEVKAQDDLLKHIEGIVAQRKAIDDLNKSIIANVAERTRMDALTKKYADMGVSTVANMHGSSNASQLASLEAKGASQASIDSLKNYLLGVQAVTKAREDQKRIEDEIEKTNQRIARDAAAARYSAAGNSSSISSAAASMEVRGIPQSVINTYIQEANAKEAAAKATRELASANKFITETEERLAAAVNNANQNLNRQSTDELAKYQRALQTVGTSTDETTRKMAALKAQLDLVAGKERANQLNHLSRAISTQMGDVGISLASGMNPLTVALQQGDQIRFALQQAGAEGAELQKAMSGAASQIASSMVLVFKAVGGFVTGVVASSAKALAGLIMAPVQFYKEYKAMNDLLSSGILTTTAHTALLAESQKRLAGAFSSVGKIALGTAAAIGVVLLFALAGVIKREQELSKAITETGAAMGYSKDSAIAFATSLNGITTNVAIEAITEFAKAGVRGTESTEKMMLAAIDLEKYGGAAIEATAASYAKLQGEPMKALQDLAEASGRVTIATLEKAKAYSDAGDRAKLLGLAESEAARVTEEKAQAMKASMSPIQTLWIDIKHAIALTWEEIQNLTRAGPIVDALRVVFQTVAVMATEVYYAIKGMGGALAALPAIAGATWSDIKNLDTGATETKRMIGVINQASDENKAAYDKAIASIMKTGKAVNTAGAMSSKQLQTNTELARSFGNAAKAEEKYLDNINRMKRERNQLEGQYNKLKGQGKEGTAAGKMLSGAMGNLDQRIKDAEEAKAKKDKGPKAKGSSFGGVASPVSLVDNTSNIQREYSSELTKTEKFIRSQRDILKLSFEAGLVSRGEYIAKDIKLITEGQASELGIISGYGERIKAEHDKVAGAIEARRKDALAATKDSGSIIKINRDAEDQLKKLNETYKTFKELQLDKSDSIAAETTKRYYESLKEQNSVMKEAKKDLEELNKAKADASEASQLELEYMKQAMFLSDGELASYKARTAALHDYIKLKSKLAGQATEAKADWESATANMGTDPESLAKVQQLWFQWQSLKLQQTQLGIDAETAARKAGMDEVNKYYMNKAMEVRDGTAAAITDGIMNGGKAGSDAIKNVLNSILRDLLNNVFKKILGTVGDMIINSIMQAQMAAGAAKSGGGFFESLVSMGLNAFAGGMGGGTGGVDYSLGSSGSSISGFRATGGFVNQGSSYMVGERGPEVFTPKQTGSITPNHKLASSSNASSEPMKVTIINNTSSAIGKVTERQISPTERALIIEDAVHASAAALHDPNSKTSKSLGQNYKMQRNR